jgi:molybdopterin-guanine dinucleotide biosynthesis protein A
MIENISGVVLAGGENRRFNGRFKPGIIIDGKTIFNRILDIIGEIFKEIIIVTNTPERFTEFTDYKIISDIIKSKGPLGGIHAAMRSSTAEAIFVFAGDMPYLDKVLIINQIDEFNSTSYEALVPLLNNYPEPLHAIYRNTLVVELERYLSEGADPAVKDFIGKTDTFYLNLPVNKQTKKAFKNINSPTDLADI